MEEKQLTNEVALRIGCLVYICVSLVVAGLIFSLEYGIYLIPFLIAYIILAFPLSLIGALIGKYFVKSRKGIWLGAMLMAFLGFCLLYVNLSHFVMSD